AQGLEVGAELSAAVAGRIPGLPARGGADIRALRCAGSRFAGAADRSRRRNPSGAAADDARADAQGCALAAAPVVATGSRRSTDRGQRAALGAGGQGAAVHSLAD